MAVTPDEAKAILIALSEFISRAQKVSEATGGVAAADSLSANEQSSYVAPSAIDNAGAIGKMLLDSAAEYITVFLRAINDPACTFAAWTSARSMLEGCAIAGWFLDPEIDAQKRAGRVFAHRYSGLQQQIKYLDACGDREGEVEKAKRLVDQVEQSAIDLGFERVLGKKGKRIGIGVRMPVATEIIEEVLGEHMMFRMASSVAHCHYWAMLHLGYARVDDSDANDGTLVPFQKSVNLEGIVLLCVTAFHAFAQPLWNQFRYHGWPQSDLETLLTETADKIGVLHERRFWLN